ncbi:FAD-dependent oxidoreductase [Candidatus Gottesmanbacteria bacterium]|nr:FAD-dependent oxidoreductase [Candidatus Gottesmanbacteria bacterium]
MNIAVIGGGFTGLSAAYSLTKSGNQVSLFEKEKFLGGLAGSFKLPSWKWQVEQHYHHWFTNDDAALGLIKDLGLEDKLIFPKTLTSIYYGGKSYPFNTPSQILSFSALPIVDRVRFGLATVYLKMLSKSGGQNLEKYKAIDFSQKLYGGKAYKIIWEPLLKGKFGKYASLINMAWFWARIKKRTLRLGYLEGGYKVLVDAVASQINKNGGKIYTDTTFNIADISKYDCVIVTTPSVVFVKMFEKEISNLAGDASEGFPWRGSPKGERATKRLWSKLTQFASDLNQVHGIRERQDPLENSKSWAQYSKNLLSIPHLHALNLLLVTKEKFLDKEYWLNINDRTFPFIAVIQQTNMIDPKYYGGNHLAWVANYLPPGHPYLKMSTKEIFETYLPYLIKINPNFHPPAGGVNCKLFLGPFAQPVFPLNYSKIRPPFDTPIPHVYLANMDMVYPWDRGTNYAIEMGEEVAKYVVK